MHYHIFACKNHVNIHDMKIFRTVRSLRQIGFFLQVALQIFALAFALMYNLPLAFALMYNLPLVSY